MLNDMMSHFELFQPVDVDNAFDLLDRYGEECWTIAGGHDSLGWFKDRGKQPAAVNQPRCCARSPTPWAATPSIEHRSCRT